MVIAIIAILAAMLLPVLHKAKQRSLMITCLSNLHQIGLGMLQYVDDNHNTFPPAQESQFNRSVFPNSTTDWIHANCLGGNDPSKAFPDGHPAARNRLLNRYVSAPESWHCPADRGLFGFSPTFFSAIGDDYRFNCALQGDYPNADDPDYNLGLKKESYPPTPSRFILMHELAVYPWQGDNISSWHGAANPGKMYTAATVKADPDKLLSPILFVDGHGQQCDFSSTMKPNLMHGLEPGKDWMWYKPRNH